jgi:L-alanine-DL-glutamate epimerase-like enolase superfamily enzyme
MFNLKIKSESFPVKGSFNIARSSIKEVNVITVTIERNGVSGRGECRPYPRYNESVESVTAQIESIRSRIEHGLSRHDLLSILPAGAARNAVDCAFWDFESKKLEQPVWELAGLAQPKPLSVTYTISVSDPETMAKQALENSKAATLKVKLSGEGDLERIQAIRKAVPHLPLIIDANESWSIEDYQKFIPEFQKLNVTLIEQPFASDNDEALKTLARPIPIFADESFHDRHSFKKIEGKYDGINIKLDKTGGLTEAIEVLNEARHLGYKIMIGCMVSSSLAMAPAQLISGNVDVVDLDGALLLEKDREHGIVYQDYVMQPFSKELWG